MKIAVLQPSYLPWTGAIHMIYSSDVFVFLDDVQWTKNDWRNRNRIRTPQGWSWLTIPVLMDGPRMDTEISEVELNNTLSWREKHLGSLQACYGRSPFFKEVYPWIKEELETPYTYISDLSIQLTLRICRYLGIRTKCYTSSQLNRDRVGERTKKLLWLINFFEADTYISGPAAKSYMDGEGLDKEGIELEWHDYQSPYYNQNRWRTNIFISYLSILDLLFSHGKESLSILTGGKKIEAPKDVKILTPEEYNLEKGSRE